MGNDIKRLRKALARIAEIAGEAARSEYDECEQDDSDRVEDLGRKLILCTPKVVPEKLVIKAAKNAVAINSFNQPELGRIHLAAPGFEVTKLFIAASTSKYWGSTPRILTVSFMETTPADLRRRILSHLNAWTRTGCISFAETSGVGDVRISRGAGGYYSYLGTDIQLVPKSKQTMNLEGFTMKTSESEFRRVIRHEAGHTLGFPHEHMRKDLVARIDPAKAYSYFGGPPNSWTRSMVDQQVLMPLSERSLMATPADQTSIMCYQLPGSITRDGRPILGGTDINQSDYDFVGQIYPKRSAGLVSDAIDGNSVDVSEEEWGAW